MSKTKIESQLRKIEDATSLESDLLAETTAVIREVFSDAPMHPEVLAEPVEAVLHLIDRCLPHWSIQLTGKASEPDGHWRCTLRKNRGDDEDEVIGLGAGPTVTLALLKALLRVAYLKVRA